MTAQPSVDETRRPLGPFVALVVVFGAVFYVLGPLVDDPSRTVLAKLPASALMFVCPMIAAVVLVHRREGVRAWLRGVWPCPRFSDVPWYAASVVLMPLVVAAAAVAAGAGAWPPGAVIAWDAVFGLAVLYLISAVAEELGWSAYATGPLLRRLGALRAGAVIGVIWALWHVVPYAQQGHGLDWIVGQCMFTVGFRILLVHLYAAGTGVTGPTLAHAAYNVSWSLSPVYDPAVAAVCVFIAAAVVGAARSITAPTGSSGGR
ncbi:CPBP family intramembrane glutamic endopeptidase [Streptosporangium sp. NPDC006930]|uniref:CPBP family intramembrane glutamic endopeptidase n=1 Tax=Streptosporangium sp. NPDC006930 TaxID=3154783 RepID=UPI0034362270